MARSRSLSFALRKQIVDACVKAMFADRKAAFQKSKIALADAIYENRFAKEEPLVLKLTPQWYRKTNQIAIACEGFHYNGESEERELNLHNAECVNSNLKMSKERAQPTDWDGELNITKEHPLWEQAQAIVKERRSLLDDTADFSQKIRSIVYAASTIAKLKEIWPEGAKFFPEDESQSRAIVPHGTIVEINKALRLP